MKILIFSVLLLSVCACRSDDDFTLPEPSTTTSTTPRPRPVYLTCTVNGEYWRAARRFSLADTKPKAYATYHSGDSILTIRASNNKNGNDERLEFLLPGITPDTELPVTLPMVQKNYIFTNDKWRENPLAAPGGYFLNLAGTNTATITTFTETNVQGTFNARLHHFRNGNFILNVKEGKFDVSRSF